MRTKEKPNSLTLCCTYLRSGFTEKLSARILFTVIVLSVLVGTPAHAFKVALNSGELSHTQSLLTAWKWQYTAANIDMEMFIGPWASPQLSRSDRSFIMNTSATSVTVCESEYRVNGLDTSWVNSRKIPTTSRATFNAGGTVEWVILYNAGIQNGVPQASFITPSELQNSKNIFNENGQPAWHQSWATIVRYWNTSFPSKMNPFHGFLYEIRINDYNDNSYKRSQVNAAVKWGLDNNKTVFVQLIAPKGPNPKYIDQYRAAVKKLRASIGVWRMKSDNLVFVCASYDSSGENVTSVPENVNGQLNQSSTTGAARALLLNRWSIENGQNNW